MEQKERLPRQNVIRFNLGMSLMRYLMVAWFAMGMFVLHWPAAVDAMLGRVADWPVDSPAALLGMLPALLAWMGMI